LYRFALSAAHRDVGSSAWSAVSDLGCVPSRPFFGYLQVAVAVNVHVADYDQVNDLSMK
jgi:hypothetical protein